MKLMVKDLFPFKLQPDREVGVEIEMEGAALKSAGINYWDAKMDGSLRGESIEYVLKRPTARKKVESRLLYLQRVLEEHGSILDPSDRCGVHIHLNCQDLTIDQLFKFATLYYIMEPLLVGWCGDDRVGNLFCLRAQDAGEVMDALIKAKESGRLQDMVDDEFRYAAMNWKAIGTYGSLEFRAMNTPKDFTKIYQWVELLTAVKDASDRFEDEADIIEKLSFLGARDFCATVLGRFTHRIDMPPNLDEVVMEGARLAQHLAYTPLPPAQKWQDYAMRVLGHPSTEDEEHQRVAMNSMRDARNAAQPVPEAFKVRAAGGLERKVFDPARFLIRDEPVPAEPRQQLGVLPQDPINIGA